MRILHVTDHYLPVLGGIETHVAALARHQYAAGHDVTVLTSAAANADGRELDDSGPVRVLRAGSLRAGLDHDTASYDLVHAHVSVVAPFTMPVAAQVARRGTATVVTVHSLWSEMGPVPELALLLTGLGTAPVTWTAVSTVAAAEVRRHLRPGSVVHVLPNAVEVVPRAQTPCPRPDGGIRLISTMRVARRKRPLQLLAIVAELSRSVQVPVELLVVGDGPLTPRLHRQIQQCGLTDTVRVTGRVDPSDVAQLLGWADVYVAPAILESFGLAALEARCVGLPVVGHAASGMTDFITPGVDGLLTGSDRAMLSALRALTLDPDLRHRISEHNRTVPSPMTWSNTMAAHEVIYLHARSAYAPGTRTRSANRRSTAAVQR